MSTYNGVSRRKFLKMSSAVGLAIALGGGLSACGSPSAPTPSATQVGGGATSGGSSPVRLDFWDMVWGPPEYIQTAKDLVKQFNDEHKSIQVNYRSIPWNNWYQTFTTAIGAGTAPDISTGAGYQAVQFYDSGAILPVDEVIEEWRKSGELEDFVPGSVDILKYDGHYVALPWAIDIRIPWYRTDMFEKAGVKEPTNWDELRAALKQLTGNGKYGMVASNDTGGTHYLYFFILNNGGGIFTKDRKLDWMNPRNVEAIKYLSSLVKDGSVSPASAGYSGDDASKAFGRGEAALKIDGPGFDQGFPADTAKKMAILPPIKGPHGDLGTVYWINNIMLYKQTKDPEATMEFLKWWSKNQKPLWTKGHNGQLPARKSFASDPYFKNDPRLSFINDKWVPVGKTVATHAPSIFPQLNAVEGQGVMQTLIQDILQGKDPVESMQKAEPQLKAIMGES
ncbi:extracellular solute-binding protein family 1 [Thermobaculum terrenum ATCC BAA-798]|uniref:Extracellular solute-binding protein family 1 n=1 Tax=Thermobaculum terrenum (strain ATCC BAA-798 / CCMEE 7001 / YNP1) TaxID=525904 RepID=D1CIM0_THET1|nr:extracellular solute-binding protein [Thermobaculum terrenum]ACZ43591.1 extracellular solute-binding protein family 1 [Thermobaculum terrenum ATCC BAA-798]